MPQPIALLVLNQQLLELLLLPDSATSIVYPMALYKNL